MEFINASLPSCISFGSEASPAWFTNLSATTSGFEATNQNWADARHSYDLSYAVRTATDYLAIKVHFNEVRGRAYKWPFVDPLDNEVTASEGQVLTDDFVSISGNGTYQLYKQYGSVNPYYRKITRPDSPVAVLRTRAAVTTNITGTDATVTYTTGEVVIANHQSGDTYAWSGTFAVPVRYETDRLPAALIDREGGQAGELLVSVSSISVIEVKE